MLKFEAFIFQSYGNPKEKLPQCLLICNLWALNGSIWHSEQCVCKLHNLFLECFDLKEKMHLSGVYPWCDMKGCLSIGNGDHKT
jgi:hypothetical protein